MVISQLSFAPSIAVLPILFRSVVSAPFSRSSAVVSARPRNAAACSAVPPSRLFALTSASCLRSTATMSVCPISAARDNRVLPDSGSCAFGSAPSVSACLTVAKSPIKTASGRCCAEDIPLLSNPLTPKSFAISFLPLCMPAIFSFSTATPSSPPIKPVVFQSRCKASAGVPPSSLRNCGFAPFSTRSFATAALPKTAAPCKGVLPFSSLIFTSAPFSIRRRVASVCP